MSHLINMHLLIFLEAIKTPNNVTVLFLHGIQVESIANLKVVVFHGACLTAEV